MALYEYKLPELGEGLHEGEIVKWHVKAGDHIEEDAVLVEVQNDKAVVEVPSPVSGMVKDIKVKEGTVSVVGDVLATIEVEGELATAEDDQGGQSTDEVKAESGKSAEQAQAGVSDTEVKAGAAEAPSSVTAPEASPADTQNDQRLILATPGVRKFAREQGVDLTQVTGTGSNGRITREDVMSFKSGGSVARRDDVDRSAAVQSAVQQGELIEERVPLKGIRKAIASAMVKSVYTAPHVTIMDEVDVTALVELREKAKLLTEQKGIKLTYLPFIVKALTAAAREFPVLNASIDEESNEIIYKKYYNIGIATDTEQGLIVPVVKSADRKNMWSIAAEIKDLAIKAREGKLAPDEMKGSTISITNIGSAGGMFFTPVINFPEVAILGTGRISEKPVVRNGELAVGQVMALSLSFDHRIIDGATAQYAVNYIKQLLEDPQLLVMEV